ncbi:unnamed protein product [Closterium sp. Naga37s-1]|nr:unnamed protein product [Closterium sp. Naga37s-1]
MVIAGSAEPSPERAAAWSAVVAKPHSGPEKVTMATKPPLPQVLTPATAVSETTLPLVPADPLAAPESGPSAPVAVPSGPAAPPAPPAAAVEPSAPPPGLDPAPPAPCAPVAAQSAPVVPAVLPAAVVLSAAIPAVAQSLLAVSATTGGPTPSVAPSAAGQSTPAVAPMAPAGQPSRPQSPDRRPSRPHSPAPHQDRKSSRRRRDSPRRYQQQPHWPSHPGGQGDWRALPGKNSGHFGTGKPHPPGPSVVDLFVRGSKDVERAGLECWPSDPHPVAPVCLLLALLLFSRSLRYVSPVLRFLHPRLPPRSAVVPPPYKTGHFAPQGQYSHPAVLKPFVPPLETRSPVLPRFCALHGVLLLASSRLAMVIAGDPWPSPKPAAAASSARERSPPVSASGIAAMKPPVPPAPKPAPPIAGVSAPPTPDLETCGAPLSPLPAPSALVAEPGHPAPVAGPAPGAPDPPVVPVNPAALPAVVVPVATDAAVGSSPMAVSATTGGQGPTVAPAGAVQPVLVAASAGHQQGQRSSRPHSPAPREERESSRRRRDSPRRNRSQANWHAQHGGRGGWAGGRGYGGGSAYVQPISLADVQRVVSVAIREERAVQRRAPAPAAPPPAVPPVAAAPPRQAVAPVPLAPAPAPSVPAASAPARDRRLRLPWVPPVAGLEFVTAAGGAVTAQYPPLLPADPAPPSALDAPLPTLPGPPRMAEVPEASLAQLWRLCEALCAVHLIQVYGHAALFQGNSLDGGPRDECLDAADRLAEILAPVLAAPARGVIAGVGQLGTAVRGLKRVLRAGTGDEVIGASAAVVRELHRSQTGLLAVHDADQF